MSQVELTDLYQIRPGKDIVDMSADDKHKLVDAAMSTNGKKGLMITFDLSSSFRRTNNRLYTVQGQQAGVPTWTEPYAKPILKNHDKHGDPIGRIVEVHWVSNDDQCMRFFDSMNDFMSFKRVMDTSDPQKIYKEMHKRNLLTNDQWPGLGRLVAKARISDQDAVEKFLDGRYLTFSAGSHTDKYSCGLCGSDWATGDICEHTPGSISDEGKPAIFVTGRFNGAEASVVTTPANSLSQIRSMEFGDSVDLSKHDAGVFAVDNPTLHFVDAEVEIGQQEEAIKTLDMDPRDLARAIWDGTLTAEQTDALSGKSHYEVGFLIRIHDAMHYEYDWRVRYGEDDGALSVPEAVFSFHGDLHKMSKDKGFRDSLYNGALDGFNSKGETSTEYMTARQKAGAADESQEAAPLVDTLKALLANQSVLQSTLKSHYNALNDMGALPLGFEDFLQTVASSHDTNENLLQQRSSSSPGVTMDRKDTKSEENEVALDEKSEETSTEVKDDAQENNDGVQENGQEVEVQEDNKEINKEEKQEELLDQSGEESSEEDSVDIDWALLDLALDAELILMGQDDEAFAGAKLTTEARTELSDENFCGPDRSFPVPDSAHVNAARRLLNRSKLSDAQKERVLSLVDSRAKAIGCDGESQDTTELQSLRNDFQALQNDYAASLELASKLQGQLDSLQEKLAKLDTDETKVENDDSKQDTLNVQDIKTVENESASSSQALAETNSKLGDYEQKIVARFKELRDEKGATVANYFLRKKIARGHLPKTFDISPYIQEND